MPWELAYGSVTGREHVHGLRNNQDAFAVEQSPYGIVAIVCDGCSSGAHSEVGAQLGARLICAELVDALPGCLSPSISGLLERARMNVLAQLRCLANGMGGSFSQAINDYFLFTVQAFIVTDLLTYVVGIGDGVFAINGEVTTLGPFAGNAPPYLGYALTGSTLIDQDPRQLAFTEHAVVLTRAVHSVLIGTDGVADLVSVADHPLPGRGDTVGPLSQFWENDRFFTGNPFLVGRRLNQINPAQPAVRVRMDGGIDRHEGLLPDDTTLVVVRRGSGV
ncbi:MAG: protein phosphatase 2C domain-containing protein [Candidatus Yanofskybacteria bacterium]|nr:protein phosphatase 2C domain-containing protein [Candidatus Yanofskybacteria bacterium]